MAPWVLFKLDGGLDHILIDEAQDTNPEQWEIVAALAEEFFAGEGAREPDPHGLCGRRREAVDLQLSARRPAGLSPHAAAFRGAGRPTPTRLGWMLPLDISFRSTEPVLQAVDAIFGRPAARDGVALDGAEIRHFAARAGHAGLVELWPPVVPERRRRARSDEALPVTRTPRGRALCPARPRHRRHDRALARQRRAAGGARPPAAARRHHGAGAPSQRIRRRIAARVEAARCPGRRRRSPGADRAIGGAGPGGARPVSAASRG